jgi:SHS2 domain-containing protein
VPDEPDARGAYRFFDHTADFAVEVRGPDVPALLAASVRAFAHLLTDRPDAVAGTEAVPLELDAVDAEDLLVTLGNELLYRFEVDGWLAARLEIAAVEDGRLTGTLHGEPFDAARHPIARPAKALTHHGVAIEGAGSGLRARLVYDL